MNSFTRSFLILAFALAAATQAEAQVASNTDSKRPLAVGRFHLDLNGQQQGEVSRVDQGAPSQTQGEVRVAPNIIAPTASAPVRATEPLRPATATKDDRTARPR
jgi:hypothetical protein